MATTTMLLRHRVADPAAWRVGYDSVEDLRQQHGCFGAEVLVNPADQKDVLVLHRFPTLEQAQAFGGSDELRQAMTRAGVDRGGRQHL
jgi:antibiotic biosynthesis monooxygenase